MMTPLIFGAVVVLTYFGGRDTRLDGSKQRPAVRRALYWIFRIEPEAPDLVEAGEIADLAKDAI